jgi:hypothetical protein
MRGPKVNYKMRMNIRRMAQGDRKHHKRSKRMNKVSGAVAADILSERMP